MKFQRRKDMKPGTIFVYERWEYCLFPIVLVVVNAKEEMDFWRGGTWFLGNVAPSLEFEVI